MIAAIAAAHKLGRRWIGIDVPKGKPSTPIFHTNYPRLQILIIADLFNATQVDMPPSANVTFKKAQRIKKDEGAQGELGI